MTTLEHGSENNTPMTKTMEKSHLVHLRIICMTPPDTKDADFGVQDRHLVLHPGQPQPDGSLLVYDRCCRSLAAWGI